MANSNSVLSVSEAFPGSPSVSTEPRVLEETRKQGLAGWIQSPISPRKQPLQWKGSVREVWQSVSVLKC